MTHSIFIKSAPALVLLLALTSCAIFEGRETGGQYVDDSSITATIKKNLIGDSQVDASQVHVETMQGVVQLSGFVDSPKSELRAVQIARDTKGVTKVEDDIVVRSKR